GTSAGFSVSATGTSLSYQWYKGSTAMAGQTGSSLSLTNISASDAAIYSVVASGTCANVTNSASLTVRINVSAPPLASLTRNPGETATFSAVASGTGPFTYVWKKNGTVLPGQTTNS